MRMDISNNGELAIETHSEYLHPGRIRVLVKYIIRYLREPEDRDD